MRREKTQISKIRNSKGAIKQTPWKSRKSSETTLRAYTLINLKISKKWKISRNLQPPKTEPRGY
jgi:hypothetical protein